MDATVQRGQTRAGHDDEAEDETDEDRGEHEDRVLDQSADRVEVPRRDVEPDGDQDHAPVADRGPVRDHPESDDESHQAHRQERSGGGEEEHPERDEGADDDSDQPRTSACEGLRPAGLEDGEGREQHGRDERIARPQGGGDDEHDEHAQGRANGVADVRRSGAPCGSPGGPVQLALLSVGCRGGVVPVRQGRRHLIETGARRPRRSGDRVLRRVGGPGRGGGARRRLVVRDTGGISGICGIRDVRGIRDVPAVRGEVRVLRPHLLGQLRRSPPQRFDARRARAFRRRFCRALAPGSHFALGLLQPDAVADGAVQDLSEPCRSTIAHPGLEGAGDVRPARVQHAGDAESGLLPRVPGPEEHADDEGDEDAGEHASTNWVGRKGPVTAEP